MDDHYRGVFNDKAIHVQYLKRFVSAAAGLYLPCFFCLEGRRVDGALDWRSAWRRARRFAIRKQSKWLGARSDKQARRLRTRFAASSLWTVVSDTGIGIREVPWWYAPLCELHLSSHGGKDRLQSLFAVNE